MNEGKAIPVRGIGERRDHAGFPQAAVRPLCRLSAFGTEPYVVPRRHAA